MGITLKELLAIDGIKTVADIDAKRGPNSRYSFLVKSYGEVNADRIMRNLEVQHWIFR